MSTRIPSGMIAAKGGRGAYQSVAASLAAAHSAELADAIDDALRVLGACCSARSVALASPGRPIRKAWLALETPAPADLGEALRAFAMERAKDAVVERALVLDPEAKGEGERRLARLGLLYVHLVPVRGRHDVAGLLLLCRSSRPWRDRFGPGGPHAPTEARQIAELIGLALERNRLSEERGEVKRRLRQSQRLEIAGATAAGMAHNLNNVLAAMLGHTETALEASRGNTAVYNAVVSIKNAGERAGELIENLLGFGRRDFVEKVVQLGALCEETILLVRPSIPTRIRLELRERSDGAETIGRVEEIQQVLFNLIRNAAQAIANEGEVVLTLETRSGDPSLAMQIGALAPREYVVLEVRDSGIGIDAVARLEIFRPFYTTRPAGTGLGLSTVADIVSEHGGALRVLDAPGGGSVFEVWFLTHDEAARTVFLPKGEGEPVLVVAERAVREKIEDVVAALGYEPLGLSHPREALRVIEGDPDNYHAVFLCTDLIELDDYFFLAERFHSVCPTLPLTILTPGRTPPTLLGGVSGRQVWLAGLDSSTSIAAALRLMFGSGDGSRGAGCE
ncbi:ATP-binding protein [Acetobacter nitrogenifigens]|nr:ATP-binding protein [Acetobacter nitrogenifigens]